MVVTASDSADSANTASQTITVTITDANEAAPAFADGATASANAAENQQAVGTYAATDTDGTASLTYSCPSGHRRHQRRPRPVQRRQRRVLTFATAPNYESPGCGADNGANVCVVVIKVSDGLEGSDDDTITVTVTVTDVNEAAPAFTAGATGTSTPNEGTTAAGTYAATDADGRRPSPPSSQRAPTPPASTTTCSASPTAAS